MDPKNLRQAPYMLLRPVLRCNAGCLFCNVRVNNVSDNHGLSLRECYARVKAVSASGQSRISISGGEPTLYPHLEKLIAYCKRSGMEKVELQTNAIALSKAGFAEKLKKAGLDQAFISLHSGVPALHDFMVGVKGAFARTVKGISHLSGAGVEITLNPVITSVNYRHMPQYPAFVRKQFRGVNFISLSVVQPRGGAWANKALVPEYSRIDRYIRGTLRAADELGLTINNPVCGVPLCVGGWEKRLEHCADCALAVLGESSGLGKVKPGKCSRCRLDKLCAGVWAEYVRIHGADGIKPVK